MQQLLTAYLFQHKNCPLPGIGTLWVTNGKAAADFSNVAINAPVPSIVFETTEHDASGLLDFIAAKTNSTVMEAIEMLGQFCNNLKSAIFSNSAASLNGAGSFFKDGSAIVFKENVLPEAFTQPVKATRVIHPQAEHNILVGDKETTNTVMTEYFSEAPVKKDRWWIWAIVIGAIALLAILIYLNTANISSMLGNAIPIN